MPSFLVSLNLKTRVGLDEVIKRLGREPDSGSFGIGSPRKGRGGGVTDFTLWRLNADADENAPLDQHIQAIVNRLPGTLAAHETTLPESHELCLDIAYFFGKDESIFPLVRIPRWIVEYFGRIGSAIEITVYPCSETPPEARERPGPERGTGQGQKETDNRQEPEKSLTEEAEKTPDDPRP
jgi:hypothetical protein